MPRPKRPDAPQRIHITVPLSLLTRLELILHDPIRNKARYGERSALIETLIREWVEAREHELEPERPEVPGA